MKKLLLVSLLIFSASANAQHGGHHSHRGYGYGWIAPAVIGATAIYAITRPIIVQQPVYVTPQIITPYPPTGYHWEQLLDATCNCYRTVLVPG